MIKEINPCEWGTYAERCKCCGMSLFEEKVYTREYVTMQRYVQKTGYGFQRGLKKAKRKGIKIASRKKMYCSVECRMMYESRPDEFGLWWKE